MTLAQYRQNRNHFLSVDRPILTVDRQKLSFRFEGFQRLKAFSFLTFEYQANDSRRRHAHSTQAAAPFFALEDCRARDTGNLSVPLQESFRYIDVTVQQMAYQAHRATDSATDYLIQWHSGMGMENFRIDLAQNPPQTGSGTTKRPSGYPPPPDSTLSASLPFFMENRFSEVSNETRE